MYLVRIDAEGVPQWSKAYGGVGVDQGVACDEFLDGYVVAGTSANGGVGGYDMTLIRLDAAGDPLWQRYYGSEDWDFASSMVVVDNGFLLVGTSYGPEAPLGGGIAMRLDAGGEQAWSYHVPHQGHSEVLGAAVAQNGDILLAGMQVGESGQEEAFVARLDGAGAEVFFTLLETDSASRLIGVVEGADGSIVACGSSREGWPVPRILVAGFSSDGVPAWQRFHGNQAEAGGAGIDRAGNGGYVITGYNTLNEGDRDMIFTLVDVNGWFQSGTNYGNGEVADGVAVRHTSDGGYIVVGWCEGYGPGPRAMYVVKAGADGATEGLAVDAYSDPLPVVEAAVPASLARLSPNPASPGDVMRIDHPEAMPLRLHVRDAQGRLVASVPCDAAGQCVTPYVESGVYLVHINDSPFAVKLVVR